MHSRFRVIETTAVEDGAKRYRVVDLVEGGSASKHGVYKAYGNRDSSSPRHSEPSAGHGYRDRGFR